MPIPKLQNNTVAMKRMTVQQPVLNTLLPALDKVRNARVRLATMAVVSIPLLALAVAVARSPRALTTPRDPTEFWTLVSAAAAVAVLATTLGVGMVAWYGLRSLRLARQDMVTRATREGRTLAIVRGEQFSAMLKGPQKEIQGELAAANVPSFTKQVASGSPLFDNAAFYPMAKAWWTSVPLVTQNKIIHFLNDVEAWAMYFTHELADASVIFGPCAPTYCSIVLQYSPWIIVCRREQFSGFYPNLLAVFRAWRAELDAQEGTVKTEAALRAARAAEDRRAQHQLGAPLGTAVDI